MDQEINLMGFNERNPMSTNERNLINATIALDTTYDFNQDYKSATKERAGN